MKLFPSLSIFMYRNEKKMFVMQQEKINNNKLTVKGMNHKDHQTDNHLFVEVSIIVSLAVYSSITKLNTEKFEMMGSSNICVFFNKTFLYLCSTDSVTPISSYKEEGGESRRFLSSHQNIQ